MSPSVDRSEFATMERPGWTNGSLRPSTTISNIVDGNSIAKSNKGNKRNHHKKTSSKQKVHAELKRGQSERSTWVPDTGKAKVGKVHHCWAQVSRH